MKKNTSTPLALEAMGVQIPEVPKPAEIPIKGSKKRGSKKPQNTKK